MGRGGVRSPTNFWISFIEGVSAQTYQHISFVNLTAEPQGVVVAWRSGYTFNFCHICIAIILDGEGMTYSSHCQPIENKFSEQHITERCSTEGILM